MLSLHSGSVGGRHVMVRRVGRRVAVQNVEVSLTGTCSSNAESQKSAWDPFMDAADLQRVKEVQVERRQAAVLRSGGGSRGWVDTKARAGPRCGSSHESTLKANDSDLLFTGVSSRSSWSGGSRRARGNVGDPLEGRHVLLRIVGNHGARQQLASVPTAACHHREPHRTSPGPFATHRPWFQPALVV
eukprot:9478275-Pyramimonas_sp.AAC.1